MRPPAKLKYQKVSGMTLARLLGRNPLYDEAHREHELGDESDGDPDELRARRRCPPTFQMCQCHFDDATNLTWLTRAFSPAASAPDKCSAIGGSEVLLRSQLTPTRSYSPIRARPRLVYFDAPLSRGRSFTGS